MSKEEILNRLKSSRELSTMDDTTNWRDAFALFNASTGHKMKAQDKCPKCYQKVLDWLQGIK